MSDVSAMLDSLIKLEDELKGMERKNARYRRQLDYWEKMTPDEAAKLGKLHQWVKAPARIDTRILKLDREIFSHRLRIRNIKRWFITNTLP